VASIVFAETFSIGGGARGRACNASHACSNSLPVSEERRIEIRICQTRGMGAWSPLRTVARKTTRETYTTISPDSRFTEYTRNLPSNVFALAHLPTLFSLFREHEDRNLSQLQCGLVFGFWVNQTFMVRRGIAFCFEMGFSHGAHWPRSGSTVRPSPTAGAWTSSSPALLKKRAQECLSACDQIFRRRLSRLR